MIKYTDEETALVIKYYTEAEDKDLAIKELAIQLDKSERSIIGKLSKEKVYIRKVYLTKANERPIHKKETIAYISKLLDGDIERLQSLANMYKPELHYLVELLDSKFNSTASCYEDIV